MFPWQIPALNRPRKRKTEGLPVTSASPMVADIPKGIQAYHSDRVKLFISEGAGLYIVSNDKGECLAIERSMDDALHYIKMNYVKCS